MATFILLFQCQDHKGIVARVSDFIFKHDGNIISADQYSTDPHNGYFFMRVEFLIENASCSRASLQSDLTPLAAELGAEFKIYEKDKRLRMGIVISRADHCLFDLLYLWRSGELTVDIPFVVANSEDHREFVRQYRIPYYFIPATKDNRREEELLSYAQDTDFLVLARYMLVLSRNFLEAYGRDIINIHHGFLPSFKGMNPYAQALEHGVKVIGATAHFVTETLDEGPIITQAVEGVSHKDDFRSLTRKGKNLENKALSNAISAYIDHRIIKYRNRTIVF